MATTKKGIIGVVNAKSSSIGRLTTGETVFSNSDAPLKVGAVVTYEVTRKTKRYAKNPDGTDQVDAAGQKVLEDMPEAEHRDQNTVLAVFADNDAYVKAANQAALLDVEVDLSVVKAKAGLHAKYALTDAEKEAAANAGF